MPFNQRPFGAEPCFLTTDKISCKWEEGSDPLPYFSRCTQLVDCDWQVATGFVIVVNQKNTSTPPSLQEPFSQGGVHSWEGIKKQWNCNAQPEKMEFFLVPQNFPRVYLKGVHLGRVGYMKTSGVFGNFFASLIDPSWFWASIVLGPLFQFFLPRGFHSMPRCCDVGGGESVGV